MNKIFQKVASHLNYNKFFFELKRTPFLKRFVSSYVYDRYDKKDKIIFSPFINQIVSNLLTKTIYVGFVFLLGFVIYENLIYKVDLFETFDFILYLWFLMLMFGSFVYKMKLFEQLKLYLISFRVPFAYFFKNSLLFFSIDRLVYIIIMTIALYLIEIDFLYTLIVILNIVFMFIYIVVKDMHYAVKYQKTKPNMRQQLKANSLDGFAFSVFLFSPLFTTTKVLLSMSLAYLLLLLIHYFFKYKSQNMLSMYHRLLLYEFLETESFSYTTKDMNKDKVTLKEKNITLSHDTFVDDYQGYDLFNKIFNERFSFIWKKKVLIFQLILGVFFMFLLLGILIIPKTQTVFTENSIQRFIFSLYIWFLYFTEIGKTLTQAYYTNADYSLLHYAFYFEKEHVWRQFLVRLQTIFTIHLKVASVLILGSSFMSVFFPEIFILKTQIYFVISIMMMVLLFSIVDLALYYLLQPYNKDLEYKSKLYHIINFLIYLFVFYIRIDITQYHQVLILSGSTVFIFCASILLIRLFAHETFKFKD